MEKRYYRIAGQCVELCGESVSDIGFLTGFEEASQNPEAEVRITIKREQGKAAPAQRRVSQAAGVQRCYGIEYFPAKPGEAHLFRSRLHPTMVMETGPGYQSAVIEGYRNGWYNSIMELLLTVIYSFLTLRGGLLAHASCIRAGEEGLLFTGPSGIGKTTQARLWEQYRGAQIISGDKAIVEAVEDKELLVWGSPWKGSSPYAVNTSAPLRAAVVLRQAGHNSIRCLHTAEKLELFTSNFFYPFWDCECMAQCMDTVDQVLGRLPVYLLSCRPEKEAVDMVYEIVGGRSCGY